MILPTKFLISDSLVASLCREASRIRSRCHVFSDSNTRCLDARLSVRLFAEFKALKERQEVIKKVAQLLKNDGGYEELSIDFLIEICSRPLRFSRRLQVN